MAILFPSLFLDLIYLFMYLFTNLNAGVPQNSVYKPLLTLGPLGELTCTNGFFSCPVETADLQIF